MAGFDFYDVTGGMSAEEIGSTLTRSRSRSTDFQNLAVVFGNSISESVNNYCTWLCRYSNGALSFYKNAGVGGNTTAQMLSRLSDIPDDADICFVMEATNDAASAVTPQQHTDNMLEIFSYIKSKGIRPVLVLAPPNDDSARSLIVNEMNLRDFVMARNNDISTYNPWDSFTNPSDGSWSAGASDDGTHPTAGTQYLAGSAMSETMSANGFYSIEPRINDDGIGVNNNACLITDSDSNGIPDRFATNGGQSSATLSSTSLGIGNTFSTNWVNNAVFINSSRFDVTAGDRYYFTTRFSSVVNSGSVSYSVALEYDVAINGITRKYFIQDMSESIAGCQMSMEFTVPDGVSTIRIIVTANSGTFDVDFNLAQVQFYNLSGLGA